MSLREGPGLRETAGAAAEAAVAVAVAEALDDRHHDGDDVHPIPCD